MPALPRLGELEMSVLELTWSLGEVDVREAHERLGEPRGITSNTVQSALERLFRKRMLTRERVSHAYRYAPAIARDAYRAQAAAEAVGELRGAQASGVLAAFVEIATRADRANLERLEEIISDARARASQGKR